MDTKKITDFKSVKELAIAMFYYTAGSIIGPLLIFGFLGYLLDKVFGTRPILLVIGVLIAFVISNVLLFKKIKNLNKIITEHGEKEEKNKQKVSEKEDNIKKDNK